ncbi:MAG TPA: ATP-binding protein, partial [Coleofasciculaceae cyanobacterium]
LGVLLGLCFVTWIVFDRLVAHRAQQVVNLCRRWEQGETEARICLSGSDEFAQIGAAFDRMAERVGESTAALRDRENRLSDRTAKLEQALKDLKQTQSQLIQTEKLSSLGQMVAGIAHEVNNPIGFIHSNLYHVENYFQSLLALIELYQQHYPVPAVTIEEALESIDLAFISQDLPQALASMRSGTDRIRDLVLSLRNFSRLDESGFKVVNLHDGLDSTITVLQSRLRSKDNRPEIKVVKRYDRLPPVECSPGQLNQVFAHLIGNAIDAFETVANHSTARPTLTLETQHLNKQTVQIRIMDNGPGMEEVVRSRIFDPFFTTKPIGKGTGLGLSLSYDIITKTHGGQLLCHSIPGKGTELTITLPVSQKSQPAGSQTPASLTR